MIKDLLKKIIPNKLIQRVRLGKSTFYYSKIIKKIKKSPEAYDYLFGTAIHTNLGDHLITFAEEKFFNDNDKKVIEIPTEAYQVYRELLIKLIPKEAIIYINGGGWLGNLWVKEELLVQDMVNSFSKNRVIIFPQTIYFDKNKEPYQELIDSAKEAYEKCKDLKIFLRDEQSYNFAKEHYPNIRSYFVPDIALYLFDSLKEYRDNSKEKLVKYCLREDRENVRENSIIDELTKVFIQKGYKIEKTSTMSPVRVSEKKREEAIKNKLDEFSKCSFIVTDRLHGMIFSYLVGTPCFILDNKTKKVSGVYEKWLIKSNGIMPLYNNFEEKDIVKFIEEKKFDFKEIDFEDLRKEFING